MNAKPDALVGILFTAVMYSIRAYNAKPNSMGITW